MSSTEQTQLHFEGVLEKAGKRFFEGFRKRWFTLDGQDLTYFKAAEKTEENYLGTINLSQVKAVNPVKMVNNGFQILTKNRTYTFAAPTPELLTDWMSVLRQAMQLQSFERRRSQMSSQSSTDSQYEEVPNRPNRSLSDASYDEDDSEAMYSCVGAPSGIKPLGQPTQAPGEMYSMVGAATMPRAKGDETNVAMYELVGSRPPSKSAPPTYEMVQSAKKNSPSGTIQESAQETVESPDLYVNSPPAEEENTELYALVQEPGVKQQTSAKMSDNNQGGTSPQKGEDERQKPADIYSVPNINRKQKLSARGLSIISESADSGDELDPVTTPEEIAPPLPPKCEESFAIDEIKRFLEETKLEDAENEKNQEQTDGIDAEDVFPDQKVSAFQQLKEFLQRLDSTEAE
ncbi:hypothetical protein ACROYT_G038688 [Oculina patagonica]